MKIEMEMVIIKCLLTDCLLMSTQSSKHGDLIHLDHCSPRTSVLRFGSQGRTAVNHRSFRREPSRTPLLYWTHPLKGFVEPQVSQPLYCILADDVNCLFSHTSCLMWCMCQKCKTAAHLIMQGIFQNYEPKIKIFS